MYGDYQQTLEGLKKQYEQLEQLTAQRTAPDTPAPQQVPTVSGIDGARTYKLGKGSSVALFDVNEDIFYLRQTDSNGNEMPLKIGHYKLEDAPKSETDYVTVKDFEALKAEIVGLLRDKTEKPRQERPQKKEEQKNEQLVV